MKQLLPVLLLLCLFSLSASSQRYVIGPGEYTCAMVDTVTHKGYTIDGTATLCPGLPTSGVTGCAGGAHHLGFIVGGNVWMMGDNANGELGNGSSGGSTSSASQITVDSAGNTFNNVIQLSLGAGRDSFGNGGWSSAALKSDGTVWVWGFTKGTRGSGTAYRGADPSTRPVQVSFPVGTFITKIQISTTALALDSAGNIWTWGDNDTYNGFYALGRGTTPDVRTPTKITLPARAVDIAGGLMWNYALLSNGSLYGFGPWPGYLGIGSGDGGGYVYEVPGMGDFSPGATPVLLDTALNLPHPVVKIYSNSEATFAILTDSTLWAWGDNAVGNLGQGTELNFATYTTNGNPAPYAWDLGLGENIIRKPVQIAPGKHNWTHVYTSTAYTFYLYADDGTGNLYSWGRDKSGLFGRGGGVLGQNILACDSIIGNINGTYPNSWDRTLPYRVNTDSLFSNQQFYSTCPLCVVNHSNPPCSLCSIPSATTIHASIAASSPGAGTILLSGSSSSPYHISFRAFTQVSGPVSAMGIQTGTADTLTGLGAGTYVFKYKVTDVWWNTDSATATITLGGDTTARDSIRIQFDTLTMIYGIPITQTNFVQMMGDPSTHVITATGGNSNGITVSSIATANWTPIFGSYAASPGGEFPTSVFPGADTALAQVWINAASSYTPGVYQLSVAGLKHSSTYTIKLSASADADAFYQVGSVGQYRWIGDSTYTASTLDAQPGGVANTTNSLTWSAVKPDSSGKIYLAFNKANSSQEAGFLGAMTITENSSGSGSAAKRDLLSATSHLFTDSTTAEFALYPNPTKGELFMHLGGAFGNDVIVGVYTADGRLVRKMKINGEDQVLQLGGLQSGVYIIRVSSATKMVTKKIMKN